MKILIIEDNEHKRGKMISAISYSFPSIIINEAYSYQEGLSKALKGVYDLLIVDMSMPTFSKTDSESGGRFRTFGGKEIINQLIRKGKGMPFIIVSQFSAFSEKRKMITLEEIDKEMAEHYPKYFIKTIFYDTTNVYWKEELVETIKKRKYD